MKALKILCAFVLIGALSACSKESMVTDEENLKGKGRLAFTVDGFTQDLVPFPKLMSASAKGEVSAVTNNPTSTDIRDHINVLDIYVYTGNTNNRVLVDHVQQYADDANFGTYERYFDREIYTSSLHVVIHGTKLEEGGSVEWISIELPTTIGVRTLPEVTDSFSLFQYQLSLDSPDDAIASVQLARYVGRLDLNLEEMIPSDAGHVEVTIENTGKYFQPGREEGFNESLNEDDPSYHTVKEFKVQPEHIADSTLTGSVYFIPKEKRGSGPSTVTVRVAAYDDLGDLIRELTLSDVEIQANRVTKLKGTIFTIPNLVQQIGLDTEWGDDFPEREF